MFPPLAGALHNRFRSFMVWQPQVSVIKDGNEGDSEGGEDFEDEDDYKVENIISVEESSISKV